MKKSDRVLFHDSSSDDSCDYKPKHTPPSQADPVGQRKKNVCVVDVTPGRNASQQQIHYY